VDARDACGCTALHRAAAQGHEGVVQHLLQHRAVASLAFQARPRLQELRLNVLPSSACPAKLCARRHRSAPQTKSMAHAPCLFICLSSEHPDLRLTRSAVPRREAPRPRTSRPGRATAARCSCCLRRARTRTRATRTAPRRCTTPPPAPRVRAACARCWRPARTRARATAAAAPPRSSRPSAAAAASR